MDNLTDPSADARKRLQLLIQSRKQLAKDKAALTNRIGFLKQEDQKTLKNIEATKQQVQTVLSRRFAAAEANRDKQDHQLRVKVEALEKYSATQTERLQKLEQKTANACSC